MIPLGCQLLTPNHLDAALALDQICLGGLWTADGYRRELESPNSDLLVLVANSDSQAQVIGLGCLWAILEEAHITLLAIDPRYQGQGLGQWLLVHLLVAGWRRQLERATLEVRASNQQAIYLYEKLGFKTAGRRRKYYSDGEDALILWRSGLNRDGFARILQTLAQQLLPRLQQAGWDLGEEIEAAIAVPDASRALGAVCPSPPFPRDYPLAPIQPPQTAQGNLTAD